jgi:hypothetical protein
VNDPKRWLEQGEPLSPLGENLLRNARSAGLRADEKSALWRSIQAQLPPIPPDGAPPAGGAAPAGGAPPSSAIDAAGIKSAAVVKSTAVPVLMAKPMAFGALLGGLVALGSFALSGDDPLPVVSPPVSPPVSSSSAPLDTASSPGPRPVAPETSFALPATPSATAARFATGTVHHERAPDREPPPAPTESASAAPLVSASSSGPADPIHERATRLRAEAQHVLQIRTRLRSGDAAGALQLLDQAHTLFPDGVLGQEREALTIEALARRGQQAAAAERARAFLQAHPHSAFAADVRVFAGP